MKPVILSRTIERKRLGLAPNPYQLVKVWGQSPASWELAQPEIDQLKADGCRQANHWTEGNYHVLMFVKFN